MEYEYSMQKVFNQTVQVEDRGNCCLECESADGGFYYLRTQSVAGFTYVLKFGPVEPDLDFLDGDFSLEYRKIKYNEKGIDREIVNFINDYKKAIVNVAEVEHDEALEHVPEKFVFIPA